MLAFFKFILIWLLIIITISAICGIIAFFIDLHNFKSEKKLSLPRKKLIQAIIDEQALKNNGGDDNVV